MYIYEEREIERSGKVRGVVGEGNQLRVVLRCLRDRGGEGLPTHRLVALEERVEISLSLSPGGAVFQRAARILTNEVTFGRSGFRG